MSRLPLLEVAEALGATLVVLGLVFLSLPVGLIAAGIFLVAAANAPGAGRPVTASRSQPAGPRAETRR